MRITPSINFSNDPKGPNGLSHLHGSAEYLASILGMSAQQVGVMLIIELMTGSNGSKPIKPDDPVFQAFKLNQKRAEVIFDELVQLEKIDELNEGGFERRTKLD